MSWCNRCNCDHVGPAADEQQILSKLVTEIMDDIDAEIMAVLNADDDKILYRKNEIQDASPHTKETVDNMIDALASITADHEAMIADSWTVATDVSGDDLIVDIKLNVPYTIRTFRMGGAWPTETTSDITESPYVSDCEISTDPRTNARGKASTAIKQIVQMFYFEPNDNLTRYQISQLIFDQTNLQTRWSTTPDGFSHLTVFGGEAFPNTLWYMKV